MYNSGFYGTGAPADAVESDIIVPAVEASQSDKQTFNHRVLIDEDTEPYRAKALIFKLMHAPEHTFTTNIIITNLTRKDHQKMN